MVEIVTTYGGGLHCHAVHGPSGSELATDAPVDNQGKGEAFSPTDLVATALATCMATTMGIVAKREGVDLEGMRIVVGKQMTADGPRRIARLDTAIHVPLSSEHERREILEAAALGCPVRLSLSDEVENPVRFHWSGGA